MYNMQFLARVEFDGMIKAPIDQYANTPLSTAPVIAYLLWKDGTKFPSNVAIECLDRNHIYTFPIDILRRTPVSTLFNIIKKQDRQR